MHVHSHLFYQNAQCTFYQLLDTRPEFGAPGCKNGFLRSFTFGRQTGRGLGNAWVT